MTYYDHVLDIDWPWCYMRYILYIALQDCLLPLCAEIVGRVKCRFQLMKRPLSVKECLLKIAVCQTENMQILGPPGVHLNKSLFRLNLSDLYMNPPGHHGILPSTGKFLWHNGLPQSGCMFDIMELEHKWGHGSVFISIWAYLISAELNCSLGVSVFQKILMKHFSECFMDVFQIRLTWKSTLMK